MAKSEAIAAGDVDALTRALRAELMNSKGNIPADLKNRKGWVVWRTTEIDPNTGKFNKIPVYPRSGQNRHGGQGSPGDVMNLGTWQEAGVAFRGDISLAGVGFALLPEFGIVAFDADHCVEVDNVRSDVARLTSDTYREISPSGTGIRAFWLGEAQDGKNHDSGFELFHAKGFVTVTGNQVGSTTGSLPTLKESLRAELERLSASRGKERAEGNGRAEGRGRTSFTGRINDAAMQNLDLWVPALFPDAKRSGKGWRVTSRKLGRDLEEDLSISISGIVDFGVHDMGDEREGRRTPVDLVMEWSEQQLGQQMGIGEAAHWLRETLGDKAPDFDAGSVVGDEEGLGGDDQAECQPDAEEAPLEPFRGPMADAVAAGLATSMKPQPELTMLATLIGMAACCEGHYHLPSGGRLNLYGVGVADTGWGKDRPRELGMEIARAGGADLIGKPASGQGLEDALEAYRGILCEVDEVAHLVEALNGSKKPAYLIELSSMLLRLFSASGGTFNPRVKAKVKDEPSREPIPHPCVNLLGFATPEKLGEAVDVVNIAEGLMGRLLVAFGRPGVTPRRYKKLALPASVTDRGEEIKRAVVVGGFDDDGIEIQITPDADARLEELLGEFDIKMTTASSPFAKALLVRSFEKCERVAGVLAVWDNPVEPRITLEHVTWAERFVNASDDAVLRFCGEYLHGGQVQADAALVLKMIQRVINKEISAARKGEQAYVKRGFAPHSMVLRASKLDKRRFDDAIAYLVDLGDIHMEKGEGVQANGRRYPVVLYTLPGG